MRRIRLAMIICLASSLAMAQYGTQFEDRGFESWSNYGSGNSTIEPVHWHSTKSASGTFSGWLSQQIEPSAVVRPGSSGTKSVRLWPTSVVGVTANGNMTNGRMNAGSMSATGSGNYNYTQRSDGRFNTPIPTVPDSIAVWVCFRSADPNQEAEVRAAIHGDADFKFVSNGTMDPADQLVATAIKHFTRTAEAGGNYQWRRLSIPFVQNGPCNNVRYILFTITTNKVPGEGGTSDDLFVDDVLLIYNPSVQMGAIEKDCFYFGESLTIPFAIDGTFSAENLNAAPNQVIAQLSSPTGSFSNPIDLGRMTTNTSGSMTVSIPQGILAGTGYRIRLVTTNYPLVSEDNGFDIIIGSGVEVAESTSDRVSIYPNPANQSFRLVSKEHLSDVALYNMKGELVLSFPEMVSEQEVSVNGITSGVYVVRCQCDRKLVSQKLLIEHRIR